MTNNNNKIILDLCGGTGAWSKPYKDAGYEVHVLTLPEWDVRRVKLPEGGLLLVKSDNTAIVRRCSDVYGILAAPPCTEFSLAKGSRPRDFEGAMKVVRACMNIIWHCNTYGGLKFWVLENPVGLLRRFLGKPFFSFEQWMYGDEGIKPTDVWGCFNIPKKILDERPDNLYYKRNGRGYTKNMDAPRQVPHQTRMTLAELRAITPAGFAQAFFKANK
jgi:site-specific DNA-cytosine methylase